MKEIKEYIENNTLSYLNVIDILGSLYDRLHTDLDIEDKDFREKHIAIISIFDTQHRFIKISTTIGDK